MSSSFYYCLNCCKRHSLSTSLMMKVVQHSSPLETIMYWSCWVHLPVKKLSQHGWHVPEIGSRKYTMISGGASIFDCIVVVVIIVWCSPGLIRFEQETGETMLGGEVFSGSEETPGLVSSSAPHHLVLPSLVTREIISQNYFSKLFFKIISAQNSPFQCRCSPSHWTLQ